MVKLQVYCHNVFSSSLSPILRRVLASASPRLHDPGAINAFPCRLGIMEDIQPIVLTALGHTPPQPLPNPLTPAVQPKQGFPQLGPPQHAQHGPSISHLDLQPGTEDLAAARSATAAARAAISAKDPVSNQTLVRLHALFSQQYDVKLRHFAFMLLSRLGSLPPTLYRPLEESELAGNQGALL